MIGLRDDPRSTFPRALSIPPSLRIRPYYLLYRHKDMRVGSAQATTVMFEPPVRRNPVTIVGLPTTHFPVE